MIDKHLDLSSPTKPKRPLSVWELPASLLTSVHKFRRRNPRKGKLRSHYVAILAFVYRNRFVVTSQVRRRFAKFLKSDRTARRHLAELHESLGLLDLVPTPSPLWPKVYCLSRRGLRTLAESLAKKGRAWKPSAADRGRSEGYSPYHVIHELFITEFLLDLWQDAESRDDLELLTVQRRSLAKHPAFKIEMDGKPTRLIPDAMFLTREKSRGMMCWFLEIDTGSMSARQLDEKFRRYALWSNSDCGQKFLINSYRSSGAQNPRPQLRVLVCVAQHDNATTQIRIQNIFAVAAKFTVLRVMVIRPNEFRSS